MLNPSIYRGIWVLLACISVPATELAAQAGPDTQRCLTREQLNIEPIFSACPPLVDEASVSDSSFISKLYLYHGYDSYWVRWQSPSKLYQHQYTYDPETGAYKGLCGGRACSLYPPAWVQQEHWEYFVGTLLAEDVGTWTYSELRDGIEYQSRTFEVRELSLTALSGENQVGLAGTQIAQPLVLKLESFEGMGIEGEAIGWSIDGPKGAKGAAVYGIGGSSHTDENGVDEAFIHLGSKPGTYTVSLNNRRVTAESQPSFTFTAIDNIDDTDPAEEHPEFEEGIGLNRAQQCDSVGNPITLSVGNKFQREVDLEASGLSPLQFVRYHNSLGFLSSSFGNYWTHSYDRYVELPGDPNLDPVKVVRPDGKKINFFWNGSAHVPHAGVHAGLERTAGGWRFTDEDLTTETFDADGRLVDIVDLAGRRQIASYDRSGRLSRVEDGLGGYLDFGYDANSRLASVTDQAGRNWAYRYEALGRLAQVDKPDGSNRQYHYEDLRHAYALTGITLENGQRYSWYEYDEAGRAIASWHAGDADRVDIQYEPDGGRIVVDPVGNATVYQTRVENKRGFLDSISGPVCSQGCGLTDTQYDYDADGNVIRKTAYGVITEYGDYDDKGQPGYVVQAVGTPEERRTDYEYDPAFRNRITRITEPSVFPGASKVTTRAYDFAGNLLEETVSGFDPEGQAVSRSTRWSYDGPFGQLSRVDGPRTDVADVTTYEYYADSESEGANRARLRAVVDANGARIRDGIGYSATGKILHELRPNGMTVEYEYYPGNDRIKSLTESGGGLFNRTQWEYYPTGDVQLVTVDDERGEEIRTRFHYDQARRLVQVDTRVNGGPLHREDQHTRFQFDAAGNVVSERSWSRDAAQDELLVERVFDTYNRIDKITRGGITEDLDYNPDGTLAAQTDGNLNTTRYRYDALKRLTSTERIGRVITTLNYDSQGNTIAVTDPENHTTRYGYDDLGNRLWQDSPDSGISNYDYNEAGQLSAQTDAGGQHSTLSYDAAGRVTAVDREGADYDIGYRYDNCGNGLGRLCEVTTGWGHSIRYTWNALGELASVTSNEGRIAYTYGPQGTLASVEYPSGRVVRYIIDSGGLVQEVRLQAPGLPEALLVDSIAYSALGRPIAWRFANGLETAVQLDGRHRPLRIDVPGVSSWTASGYDADDNLLGVAMGGDEFAFHYDALDRLTGAESSDWTLGFSYDDVGNRLSRTTDGIVESGSYAPGSNRLEAFGDRQYTVDPNGNTTALSIGQSLLHSYLYSSHNRLTAAIDGASSESLGAYRYDAHGQRVEKTSVEGVRKFLYGPNGELLAVTDGAGKVLHEYVYVDGRPLVDLFELPDTPTQEAPETVIIDDGQASVFGSNWQSKSSSAAVNGSFLQNRKRDDRAVYWYIDDTGASGSYDIHVRWLNPPGDGSSTRYAVRVINDAVNGYDRSYITIQHADHQPGDWVLLGNFDIKPRHGTLRQMVQLTGFDNPYGYEGTFLEADAIKLVPTFTPAGSSDTRFIHGDHLGTPQFVTDDNGQVVWSASYLPFGNATVDEDPDGDGIAYELNLRFPGQYYDAETGLHYNYFRDYDALLGRYIETDPAGLHGGLNSYEYALNSPANLTDPLGLWVMKCSRRLGGPFEPAMDPEGLNPFRHDFLVVSGAIYSFGAGGDDWWDFLLSQGEIRQNEIQNDQCIMVCEDDEFDKHVKQAIAEIGATIYCVNAYPGTLQYLAGARNCQTWANDVISTAKRGYLDASNRACPNCFGN